MPNEDQAACSSGVPNMADDRLRDANEHLMLKALQSDERAEESEQRYLDQTEVNKVLVRQQQQLRSLASELVLTEQRERKRLATELHDYLAQMLVLGRLKLSNVRSQLGGSDPVLVSAIGDIDKIFIQSLGYTRTLMAELSPPVLYDLGLPAGLKWLGEHMLKYGLRVEVHLSHDHVSLADDQVALLYYSVRELLLNVVKHANTSQARLSLSVEGGDQLRIVVRDHGSGFDAASLEANIASEHFGLFSIRERMDAMGGWLQTDSAPDRGTTITLGLSLRDTVKSEPIDTALTTRPPLHVKSAPKARAMRRILLVDDHAMVRQGLRTILDNYDDVTVIGEAGNGREAVSMAADLRPDVILMDINMPKLDGIEATTQIKAAQPETIVIGLSVNTSPQVWEAMQRAGAAAFVSKEAAAEELHNTIAALIPMP
jgi:signal transduction histidine kinase/CheY-like chemotaxis protein